MKDVVAEENRSRNLVIFGFTEDTAEQITEKVSEVFKVLAEKPKIEAVRIGLNSKKQAPRPVKVSITNATIVIQTLSKCSAHRGFATFISYIRRVTSRQYLQSIDVFTSLCILIS